jgi:phosphopantothenoylcysteine decarboxylase/phosphopantothenate--cysteine ligase
MLQGKNILLGICGSIAAYKAASLIRLMVKAKANVQVIMTPYAKNFITPLTLSTLSGRPVLSQYFDPETGAWSEHVKLALWADYILIAPASANTLAKFANGLCDNLLAAVYLSAKCPIYVAPAMDLDMWIHKSTQDNIARLQSFGNKIIPPGTGELASGLFGEGRMAEPEDILSFLQDESKNGELTISRPLLGKKALVTAGPTYEAIDPVRFIGNHSSGKMGYAIAETLQKLGAEVTLISGPSSLPIPENVKSISVVSAKEMLARSLEIFPNSDITVMSAAVADYRPKDIAKDKIKKQDADLIIELEKTTDILSKLGSQKTKNQLLIGFALETTNELENAKSKLVKKNLDFIVLNSLQDKGAGFAGDQNKITILTQQGEQISFELKPKSEVAMDICKEIIKLIS